MSTERNIAIKICGMRDGENIKQVASFDPDYMGFIFYPLSPRYTGEHFKMPVGLPASLKRVGVFVNESTVKILEKTTAYGLSHVQLHGNESVGQCLELMDKGLRVIKVFSVDDSFDFQRTKPYIQAVDYLMFDTKGKFHGGNAVTFNWEILRHYDQEVPFFLSGGLTPENVNGISELKHMNLYALDLNSGVEEAPGLKSIEKVKTVFNNPTLFKTHSA